MLINELKQAIKTYNKDEKDKIIIELYKKIPKKKIKDSNIDDFILNVNKKIEVKAQDEFKDYNELEAEINYFLACVNQDLYASPNKIISKSERSKWRFKVKKYYKLLNSYSIDSDEGKKATDLLKELFIVLSEGSHYLKFSNWETFRAIGISQEDFYDNIIKRKLTNNFNLENLKYCIDLLDVEKDPYSSDEYIITTLIGNLKTIDMKYLAIDLIKQKVKEKYDYKELNKSYSLRSLYNFYVETITKIYFSLKEIKEGIEFYQSNYFEKDSEVKEYIILNWLKELGY